MTDAMQVFYANGLLPVVVIDDARRAVPLARALWKGGLSAVEITLRTDAGLSAIAAIHSNFPEMFVGAGTVLCCMQAEQAVAAGAQFIVSPGFNPEVVKWCQQAEIPVFPGVSTPSEVEMAMDMGLRELKFFPAEASGGTKMLKALSSPYREVTFIPTGGIGIENLSAYLDLSNVTACGGSWLCPREMVSEGEYGQIERLTRQAVQKIQGFSISRVVFHEKLPSDSETLLQVLPLDDVAQINAGDGGWGENSKSKGTIVISVNNFNRAEVYLQHRGVTLRQEGYQKGKMGMLTERMGSFDFYLVQK